jgi:hypothetical protein
MAEHRAIYASMPNEHSRAMRVGLVEQVRQLQAYVAVEAFAGTWGYQHLRPTREIGFARRHLNHGVLNPVQTSAVPLTPGEPDELLADF